MFGLLSVPWDFFHIGLLIVVIMVLITGMVICVSVIGVCCFHWLEGLERPGCEGDNEDREECQYSHHQQAVHVIVLPEKGKSCSGEQMDPCQLREHFNRVDTEMSQRRFLYQVQPDISNGPPPSYDVLYPDSQLPVPPPQPPPPINSDN